MLTTVLAAPVLAVDAVHRFGPGPGFGFGLFLLIPLFWIGLFALVFWLVGRRARRNGWGPGARAPWAGARAAETTLSERFAQGDIDEKEYRARLEVLRANQPGPAPKGR